MKERFAAAITYCHKRIYRRYVRRTFYSLTLPDMCQKTFLLMTTISEPHDLTESGRSGNACSDSVEGTMTDPSPNQEVVPGITDRTG